MPENRWERIKNPIETREKPEQDDIKMVLQESQEFLSKLKDRIFIEQNQQNRIQYQQKMVTYITYLSEISILSLEEKQLLSTLKTKLENKQLASLEEYQKIGALLENIEQKAEQLTDLDKQKIRESQSFIGQQHLELQSLKGSVTSLSDAHQKVIDQIKEHLDKHWRSKWLSDPIVSYMEDKYIHKKSVGKFRERLVGGLGMLLAGWFLPKGLKEVYEKIETLSLDQFLDFLKSEKTETIKDSAHHLGKLTGQEYQELSTKMQEKMYHFFEKKFGRTLDKAKFSKVYTQWSQERKEKINLKGSFNDAKKALDGQGEFDTFWEAFSMLMIPGAAGLDFIVKMTKSGLISWSELAIDGVLLPSGKTVITMGISSIGLFGNGIKALFGQIDSDELIEYVKKHNDNLDMDSKMAIWWVMYRRGGWFWKLAGQVGVLAWDAIAMVSSGRTGGDIGKLKAYFQWGIMGKFEKELQVFKQFEEAFAGTKVFGEVYSSDGSTLLKTLFETNNKNLMLFDIMSNNSSFAEIEKRLKAQGLDDVLKRLKTKPSWGKDLAVIKKEAGNLLVGDMQSVLGSAKDSLETRKKWHKSLKLPRTNATFEQQLLSTFEEYSKFQGKLLQDTEMFHQSKNFLRKFTKGNLLAGMVDTADQAKFYIKDVKTAKEFFDNVRTIGKHSPEVLKTLFKGLPMIMIGKEVTDKLADPNNQDGVFSSLVSGLMYMTPIVGPIKLIQEGLTIKDGQFSSLSSAGVGVGLVTLDGIFFVKNVLKAGKGAKIWALSKFMFSPIVDSVQFMKSIASWWFTALKLAKDWVQVLRAWEYATFGVEALRYIKQTGAKVAGFALLAYLGYEGISSMLNSGSEEEKKMLAELQKMDHFALEKKLKSERPKMTDEDKAQTIKLATAQRMGITNLDLLEVKKTGNQIFIKFKTLVNYWDMKQTENDLQHALSGLEVTKNLKLNYSIDGGELKYQLLARKNDFKNQTGDFDKTLLQNYLRWMAYPETTITAILNLV